MLGFRLAGAAALLGCAFVSPVRAEVPDAIAAKGQTEVVTLHAVGLQVYECKSDRFGRKSWEFREPIATLILDGKTVGRHYDGPIWEHVDGSRVVARKQAVGRASGATKDDLPWLKLDVAEARGTGALAGITTVQRINTQGGSYQGECETPGAFYSAPYTADYVFLKK